jgi:hypothetical protein
MNKCSKLSRFEYSSTEIALHLITVDKTDLWFDGWRTGQFGKRTLQALTIELASSYKSKKHIASIRRNHSINYDVLLECLRCWKMFDLAKVPFRHRVGYVLNQNDFSEIDADIMSFINCRVRSVSI